MIKSDLREDKIAVIRSKANDQGELEVTLLSERSTEKAKQKIVEDFPELLYLRTSAGTGSKRKLVFGFSEQDVDKIKRQAVQQSIETLRNRVDQFGVAEPEIQRAGKSRIILKLPGIQDIESVKQVVGKVARLEFRLTPQSGSQVDTVTLKDTEGQPVVVEDEVLMSGDSVAEARVNIFDGQVEVSLTLTSEGGRLFRKVTGANVGRNMSIVLDDVVYSSPTIREAIGGGQASISGGFTLEEARQLAVVLRAGALPAPLDVLEERTIGPSLGQESIEKGLMAIAMAFAWVILFMVIYYRKSGMVAVGTLLLNLVLIMALLSAFGATLTLPGLAALALTVGMAVDANVLIFERIREELSRGADRDVAVDRGFGKAFIAIIDSNITTLLAGTILWYIGTGPVRGFAVTLCIGILTTLYCATFVGRLAFDVFPLKAREGLSV